VDWDGALKKLNLGLFSQDGRRRQFKGGDCGPSIPGLSPNVEDYADFAAVRLFVSNICRFLRLFHNRHWVGESFLDTNCQSTLGPLTSHAVLRNSGDDGIFRSAPGYAATLYIPLGGNRYGALRTYINLFIVMFLGGLWHGAAWSYALWGTAHGVLLALERLIGVKATDPKELPAWTAGSILRAFITFNIVSCLWLLFKLPIFRTS
jgi:hypothetical protein